jgi:membrane protease YdiL (CAAX protease family)
MLTLNIVSLLLSITPFIAAIQLEQQFATKWKGRVNMQQVRHWMRLATIGIFLVILWMFFQTGWLSASLLYDWLLPTKKAVSVATLIALVTFTATWFMQKGNLKSDRNKDTGLPMKTGIIGYVVVWIVYLFCYEIFMRGFLLPKGIWSMEIVLSANIIFYTLIHLPQGKLETLGAFILGVILTPVTWWVGSIWPVFVAHSCISIFMDIIPTYRRKETFDVQG